MNQVNRSLVAPKVVPARCRPVPGRRLGRCLAFTLAALAVVAHASVAAATTVSDGFKAKSIDNSKWSVVANEGGSIQTGAGIPASLVLEGGMHKRVNSNATFGAGAFAAARLTLGGDYQKFGFDVNAEGQSKIGVYFDTLETTADGGDAVTAIVRDCRTNASCDVTSKPLVVSWGEPHVLQVLLNGGNAVFSVDGVAMAIIAVGGAAGANPVGIWNDRGNEMAVDWVFASTLAVNLSGPQLADIASDVDAPNFCGSGCNTNVRITTFNYVSGVLYSAQLRSFSTTDQNVGIFVLDEDSDLTFARPPFDVRVVTVGASATFNDLGWGGTIGESSTSLGLLGAVRLSNIVLRASPHKLDARLTLWFSRESAVDLTALPIMVTIQP